MDPDPEPDPDADPSSRKRIRIKMKRIRNTDLLICSINWSVEGMIELRNALSDIVDEFGCDDGGFQGELPVSQHVRSDRLRVVRGVYFSVRPPPREGGKKMIEREWNKGGKMHMFSPIGKKYA